jgi:hypothetical protein
MCIPLNFQSMVNILGLEVGKGGRVKVDDREKG